MDDPAAGLLGPGGLGGGGVTGGIAHVTGKAEDLVLLLLRVLNLA